MESDNRPDAGSEPTPPQATAPISGEMLSTLINLSGKRRFMSQRIVLFTVLAAQKHPNALLTALDSLESFRHCHTSLMDRRSGMPGVFCTELNDAYFGQGVGDMRIRSFIDLAEGTLIAIGASSPDAPGLVTELIDCATPVLDLLNDITLIYENQASRHAQTMKNELARAMKEIRDSAAAAQRAANSAHAMASQAGDADPDIVIATSMLSAITAEIDLLAKRCLEQKGN